MATTETPTHEQNIEKLASLIKGIKIGMLTTVEESGSLRSRPMATQDAEFDGDLWFFTGNSEPKTREIDHDHHVNISYASPEDNRYVSVSGQARLVDDPAKIKELWSPIYKAWFPKGLEDPTLGLLRVTVEKAEYWESPSSTVVQIVGFVKALATGKAYDGGENQKITL